MSQDTSAGWYARHHFFTLDSGQTKLFWPDTHWQNRWIACACVRVRNARAGDSVYHSSVCLHSFCSATYIALGTVQHFALCTKHILYCVVHCVLCTKHILHCVVHCVLCSILHCVLNTILHCVLYKILV